MADERIRDLAEKYVDRIWGERLDRLTYGSLLSSADLHSMMRGARDDLASAVQQCIVQGTPAETKQVISSFLELSRWLADADGAGAVRAAPVSQSDVERVEAIIRRARGHNGS